MTSKLLWVSFIVSVILAVLGLGVIVFTQGWLVGLPSLVLLSLHFTFSYFALGKYAGKWNFISGEFEDE